VIGGGEEKADYISCGGSCWVYFVVDRLSFYIRAVLWSLFIRDWGGDDSVDVIEALSLRIFAVPCAFVK